MRGRGVAGPIEVVPTRRRGEAALVAPVVAIARGWSRPIDTGTSPIFYDGTLNADTYRKWLDDNAVSYVALSNGPYDWAASDEATLVRSGLPYLQPVWSDPTWTLYAVRIMPNPAPVISSPGRVITRDPVSLTVTLPKPGEYVVRVLVPILVRIQWVRETSPRRLVDGGSSRPRHNQDQRQFGAGSFPSVTISKQTADTTFTDDQAGRGRLQSEPSWVDGD